jgi:hypothetical protein
LAAMLFGLAAFLSSGAQAEDNPSTPETQRFGSECIDLIKECFGYGASERSQCFYNSAKNGFCQGTQAGRLSFKRWAMSPNTTTEAESTLGLLGPQMVDKECIANFDNQWSSNLIKGDTSSETYSRLEARLDSCRHSPANEILRP